MSFGPQNANAALVLPSGIERSRYGAQQSWVKDASAPGANDGTVLDAAFFNRIVGNLDYLLSQSNVVGTPADFTLLHRAVIGAVASGAPAALDTFLELAAAMGNDPHFATTIMNALSMRLRFDLNQQLTLQQQLQAYANLGLMTVAWTGSYNDLSNLPSLFDGTYASLSGKPTLFDGVYASLTGKPTLGTAAALAFGIAAGNLVRLDPTTAKLPAVDGSLLTNYPYASLTGKPTLGTAAALNVGAGVGNVVQLDPTTGKLPAVDGSLLTNIPYANLSGKPTLGTAAALNVGVAANQVVQLDGSAKLPAVDGSQLTNLGLSGLGALRGYLAGLGLSTGGSPSATFTVAPGIATDKNNAAVMTLSASLSKTTAAWAVGAFGGLDTGAVAINTWYHVYLIRRSDTGVTDVCISVSATAPTFGSNIPAAYTQYRRLGSMKTDGVGGWIKFSQRGDEFLWDVPPLDVNANNPGAAAVSRTLSTPPGVVTSAIFNFVTLNTGTGVGFYFLFTSLDVADGAPASSVAPLMHNGQCISNSGGDLAPAGQMTLRTNTSAQIRTRAAASDANCTVYIATVGWKDTRGRDD